MRMQFFRLMVRWAANTMGLWVAAVMLDKISYTGGFVTVILAGLILSIINALIKPFLVILSLPAIMFTMGIFMIVVNGFMVGLMSAWYDNFQVASFSAALLAGLVVGLVNYGVSILLEGGRKEAL